MEKSNVHRTFSLRLLPGRREFVKTSGHTALPNKGLISRIGEIRRLTTRHVVDGIYHRHQVTFTTSSFWWSVAWCEKKFLRFGFLTCQRIWPWFTPSFGPCSLGGSLFVELLLQPTFAALFQLLIGERFRCRCWYNNSIIVVMSLFGARCCSASFGVLLRFLGNNHFTTKGWFTPLLSARLLRGFSILRLQFAPSATSTRRTIALRWCIPGAFFTTSTGTPSLPLHVFVFLSLVSSSNPPHERSKRIKSWRFLSRK